MHRGPHHRLLRLLVATLAFNLTIGVAGAHARTDRDGSGVTAAAPIPSRALPAAAGVPGGALPPPPAAAPPAAAAPTPIPVAPAPEAEVPVAAVAAGTAAAPAPSPTPSPAPAASPGSTREERVASAFEAAVPASWRAAIEVRFEIIEGDQSWAHTQGSIQIAAAHADRGAAVLADVVAHEFGHLVAFRYGSQAYLGAAPEGWPAPEDQPQEAWADCVQHSFTGRASPSHGLAPCDGEQLSWALTWLAQGPAAHRRTR